MAAYIWGLSNKFHYNSNSNSSRGMNCCNQPPPPFSSPLYLLSMKDTYCGTGAPASSKAFMTASSVVPAGMLKACRVFLGYWKRFLAFSLAEEKRWSRLVVKFTKYGSPFGILVESAACTRVFSNSSCCFEILQSKKH